MLSAAVVEFDEEFDALESHGEHGDEDEGEDEQQLVANGNE